MTKKAFFEQRTQGEISDLEKGYCTANLDSFVNRLTSTAQDERVVFKGDIVPKNYKGANKFKKHANEVKLKRTRNEQNLIANARTPVQLRHEAFSKITNPYHCGYSYKGTGLDKRSVVVSLDQCVAGALLFMYDQKLLANHTPTIYGDSRRAGVEGADCIVSIASRTKKHPRYGVTFYQVPIKDDPAKFALWQKMRWKETSKHQQYRSMRRKYFEQQESSSYIPVVAHAIAAYHKIVSHEWANSKNIIPLQMNPFAIPTQKTVDVYQRIQNNVLVRTKEGVLRKPNQAESEIMLWELVNQEGHDATFYATKKLVDYSI